MPSYLILLCAALYLCFVYALARWGERRAVLGLIRGRGRAVLHGLALGVYCSTWTVFGAIGSALRDGYVYLAIYLGPLLVALFAPTIWERLVALKQRHRLASVADFLGARYGQAGALAALVALVSLAAVALCRAAINRIERRIAHHRAAISHGLGFAFCAADGAIYFALWRAGCAYGGRTHGACVAAEH